MMCFIASSLVRGVRKFTERLFFVLRVPVCVYEKVKRMRILARAIISITTYMYKCTDI